MVVLKNYSLKKFNTFGLEVKADNLVHIRAIPDFKKALKLPYRPIFVLGGGSNILLTKNVKGLVLKNEIKGIAIVEEYEKEVIISVGGGENWHQLVLWSIKNNYGGLENLSLIPGTVGAAPIQNIGAYGVELKDIFVKLEALNLSSGRKKTFKKADCQFAYRDSIFKKALKGKYFISKVFLKLSKKPHTLNISYGAIKKLLAQKGIKEPDIKAISETVIAIRSTKLPDPVKLGNAGSFFKNPEINPKHFAELQSQFPNIVFYDLPNGDKKIPAGWLIERCGWKGKRIGQTGAHSNQALVLVNYGNATGAEIKKLALEIIDSVNKKFGIPLSPEVNIL